MIKSQNWFKHEILLLGTFVGFIIGFLLSIYLVNGPYKSIREKNAYSQGVRDGFKGKFEVIVEQPKWTIVPLDTMKTQRKTQ